MYAALFNRAPEKAGLDFWCGQLDSGVSLAAMAQTMYETAPARATYPDGISNADVVKAFYLNVLGRAGDAEGLAFWEARLNTLGTKGALIAEMVANVQSYAGTDPAGVTSKALFDNKCAVGVTYAVTLGKEDIELAKTVLALVTATDKTAAEHAANVGQTFTLTTGADTLVGGTANDTFTGDKLTFDSTTDKFIDASKTDADKLNLTLAAAPAGAFSVVNIESVNLEISSTGTATVNAASFEGVQNLNVMRTDVTVGGSTIAGNKQVDVSNVDASKVAKVTVGAGTTNVNVGQVTKAGATIDANTATGTVRVVGAATVNADAATGTGGDVTVTAFATSATSTTENAKDVTINAAKAETVAAKNDAGGAAFTGKITINAAAAKTVTVDSAAGGGVINAAKATAITAAAIDDSGLTINAGTGTKVAPIAIDLTGKATSTVDAATIAAAGLVTVDVHKAAAASAVDVLNLSGAGAAVTYTVKATQAGGFTTIAASGDQTVNVSTTGDLLDAKTVTGVSTLSVSTAATAATLDLSKVATATTIEVASDFANDKVQLATGATVAIAKDQTTGLKVAGKAADAAVTLKTADDTAADGTTIDLVVGALDASENVKTLNIDATAGKLTATKLVAAATTAVTISGSKDVTFSSTTAADNVAKSINAANLTGALSLYSATIASITGGSGADLITLNDGNSTTTAFTLDAGNGDNKITVANAKETSTIATGTGADEIAVNTAAAIVVSTGAGNDTVTVGNVDSDAILVGGDGSDTLKFTATQDLSQTGTGAGSNTNFAFTGFETVDLSGTGGDVGITVRAATIAGQTFTLKGDSAADALTVVGTDNGDTINASTITQSGTVVLTLDGGKGNDVITGSAKNDIIIGGAGSDTIDGGAGTDTFSAAHVDAVSAVEGATAGVQSGVVINLGATAVTNTTVLAANGAFTADTVTSVAANSAAYLYSASATTNSAAVDTLSSIENVIGSAGNDYIVGSVGANTINGGNGIDYIIGGLGADNLTGGAGVDTFAYATGHASSGTVTLATALTLAQNDTIVGAEVITDIAANDKLVLGNASATEAAGLVIAQNEYVIAQGTYNATSGTFTVGATGTTGADSILFWDTDSTTAGVQAGYVVLVGVVTAEEGTATAGVITFA
jgi:Ca2+-binding RTX toxin-like protein